MHVLPHLVLAVTLICHDASGYASDPAVFEQPLITYRDANIAVEQSIGSPPQKLRLVVDLFSNATTSIPGACCAKCCMQRRFAPWKSSSFREISNDADTIILAEDVMQFPNSVDDHIIVRAPLAVRNFDVALWDQDKHLDGYAGFVHTGKNSTFVDILFNQMKPQFVMYNYRTCNNSYATAGSVAYGTPQNKNCNAFKFQALRQDEGGRVLFPMQKLSLGTLVVDAEPGEKVFLTSQYYIGMPPAAFVQLNATLHASGNIDERFFVDCNLNPGPLTLTFGDPGVTYSIPFSQLITNVDGVCELNILTSFDYFFIGLPFLREYCVAVNYDKMQVGFATHGLSGASPECKYASEPKPASCPATVPKECSATRSTPSTASQPTNPDTTTPKSSTRSNSYLVFVLSAAVISALISTD